MVCALIVSAFAAQNALATNGTTLQTCVKDPNAGAGFSKAHCTAADAVESNRTYKHVEAAQDKQTEVRGTTNNTTGDNVATVLKSTQSGIAVEIRSTLAHLEEAALTNKLDASGEHYFEGEGKIRFTNVTMPAPAGKGCAVKTGEVVTEKLKMTSKGQGDSIRSSPVAGELIAEFEVEGCGPTEALKSLNGKYQVTGSATCVPDGATLNCTHAQTTAQMTLKLRGQKAGFEASFIIEGKDASDVHYTQLSTTTVVT